MRTYYVQHPLFSSTGLGDSRKQQYVANITDFIFWFKSRLRDMRTQGSFLPRSIRITGADDINIIIEPHCEISRLSQGQLQ